MYEYKCKVVRVVDGDTVDVDIFLGFSVVLSKQRIRLYGIDAPESRTRDLEEKKHGLMAKKFLIEKLTEADETNSLIIRTEIDNRGKYGRILGTFISAATNLNINTLMINKHHAVEYFGQSKDDIIESHLKNREYFVDES